MNLLRKVPEDKVRRSPPSQFVALLSGNLHDLQNNIQDLLNMSQTHKFAAFFNFSRYECSLTHFLNLSFHPERAWFCPTEIKEFITKQNSTQESGCRAGPN